MNAWPEDWVPDTEVAVTSNGNKPGAGVTYINWRDLFTKPPQPVEWHVKPLLVAGRVSLLYSPGKAGKSLLAMEMAAALATGRGVLDTHTPVPVPVLYIDQEMTPEDWRDRLGDMGYTEADVDNLEARLHLAQLQPWLPMDTMLGGAAVLAETERIGACVVIIDTASKVIRGEENANDTQQAFYRNTVVPLKRAGVSVLVLDHMGKDHERGARGASTKTDNVDLAFELVKRTEDKLTLRCTYHRFRDDALLAPTLIHRHVEPTWHEIEAPGTPTAGSHKDDPGFRPTGFMEKVSRYVEINPGMPKETIVTAITGKAEYIRLAMELLEAEGYIRLQKDGKRHRYHHEAPYREDDDQ